MAFTKITNVDTANKGVVGLPDTPGLSTAAMQAKFDELATDVIIPKHNSLIDELEATTAAASIGSVNTTHASGANVQTLIADLDTFLYGYVGLEKTSIISYVDGKDSAMKTYVDNNVLALSNRIDAQDTDIANALSIANVALFNSQLADGKADDALNKANNAESVAESAEHDALTALQGVTTIMALIQLLLGHVYVNTENDDRLNCENGDRILMDY